MAFVAGAVLTAAELNAFSTTTIVTTGDVGIGTPTPGAPLQIDHATSAAVRLNDTGGTVGAAIDSRVQFYAGGAQNGSVGYESGSGIMELVNNDGPVYVETDNAHILLRTIGTTRMKVDEAGNVGIGTTAPTGLLQLGDGSTAGSFRVHASGGDESFRVVTTVVRSTNIVGLTTAAGANVYISSGNNTLYMSTSSARFKSDVEDLEDDYADRVLAMRPVWFRSATGNDPVNYSYYGLIAEEVAEIDPRLVNFGPTPACDCPEDPEDPGVVVHSLECCNVPTGVQYDRLVPHLISVAKRQANQIADLTARLEALEAALEP